MSLPEPKYNKNDYQAHYPELLIRHMAGGHSYMSFAGSVNVSPSILREWEEDYPDFKEAREIGTSKCMLFFEKLGIAGAAGKVEGFNSSAYKLQLEYRFMNPVEALKKNIIQIGIAGNNQDVTINSISDFIDLPPNGRDKPLELENDIVEITDYTVNS